LTAGAVANVWNQIMVDGFGYDRYVGHGSDLGAGVTARLARRHPETVVGIHLATPGLAPPPKPWNESEAKFFGEATSDSLPSGDPATTPTAVSIFGGERVPFPKPPRDLADRYFSVTSWAEHERGGHFPTVSEPQLLAMTLRDAFRPFRASR
jgi:pimeloyl-ACP methyl ester carboxylesterase